MRKLAIPGLLYFGLLRAMGWLLADPILVELEKATAELLEGDAPEANPVLVLHGSCRPGISQRYGAWMRG